MKRVVGFVRHRRNATEEERTSATQMIISYAERTGASVAQVFEVPSNAASEHFEREFQRMLRFVEGPANAVSVLVLPSMQDVPRGVDAIKALERVRRGANLELVVLNLESWMSGATALDVYMVFEFSSRLDAHARSELIKRGMRAAKVWQGGQA